MQAKTVVSIAREASALAAFTAVSSAIQHAMKADGNESAKIQDLAKRLAAQVADVALPLASKVALIKATYADEFAQMAATKDLTKEQAKRKSNATASLVAALTCYCAADLPVEVKAPADGKPAEFVKAAELPSLSAMKIAAASVKEMAKASEAKAAAEAAIKAMSPADKAKAQAEVKAQAEAKALELAAETAAAVKAANLHMIGELEKRLTHILADNDCRAELEAAFMLHGLQLAKAKRAPISGSMAEQLRSA